MQLSVLCVPLPSVSVCECASVPPAQLNQRTRRVCWCACVYLCRLYVSLAFAFCSSLFPFFKFFSVFFCFFLFSALFFARFCYILLGSDGDGQRIFPLLFWSAATPAATEAERSLHFTKKKIKKTSKERTRIRVFYRTFFGGSSPSSACFLLKKFCLPQKLGEM